MNNMLRFPLFKADEQILVIQKTEMFMNISVFIDICITNDLLLIKVIHYFFVDININPFIP